MLVNVTDVFTSEGKVLTQEFAWETAEITHDGSSYPVKSSSKLLLKLTNTAQGLTNTIGVFDQGDTHKAFTVFTETDAGRNGDLGFLQQAFGEFHAAHGLVELGELSPDIHGGLGFFYHPA